MTNTLASIDADFVRFRDHGDAAALARVFDALAPRLLLVAAHLARDAAQCEDLVQAVFVDALRDAAQYDGRRSVASWLAGILRHRAVDRARSERARGASGDAPVDFESLVGSERDPLDAAQDNEWFERVTAAIERIDEPYRAVLALRLVHGLEPRAIAHALGRAPGAVRMQLLRGLEKLRVLLPAERVLGLTAFATFTAGESARGLAAVRAEVLTGTTSALPAATVAGGAFLGGWMGVVVATVAAAAIAASIWLSGNEREETRASQLVAGGGAGAASATIAEPTAESEAVAALATAIVAERAPIIASNDAADEAPATSATADEDGVRIVGRVLMPDGSPARASVWMRAFALDDETGEEILVETDVETDGDGRFVARVAMAGPFMINAHVRCAPFAEYVVYEDFGPVADGAECVVPDIALLAGARIRGRVVDERGAPLESLERFRLIINSRASSTRSGLTIGGDVVLDEHAAFATDVLPVGPARVTLSGSSGRVDLECVVGIDDSNFDVVWNGPLPSRSIAVSLHPLLDGARSLAFEPQHVRLEREGVDFGVAAVRVAAPNVLVFADVPTGTFDLVFDDPRYALAGQVDVRAGDEVHLRLEGGATVFAAVTLADGSLSRGHRTSVCFDVDLDRPTSEYEWCDLEEIASRQPGGESYPGLLCLPSTLRFEAEGCVTKYAKLPELARDRTERVEVVLLPDEGLRGVVWDAHGAPVAGVRVRARPSRADGTTPFEAPLEHPSYLVGVADERQLIEEHETRSAVDGSFVLFGVPDVDHDVEARLSEFVSARARTLRPGEVVELQLPPQSSARGRLIGVAPDRLRGFFVSLLPVAFEQERRAPLMWPYALRVPPGAVDEQGAFELLGAPLEPVELFLHYPMWIDRTGSWSPGVAYTLGTFDPRTTSLDGLVFDVSRFGPARVTVHATLNGAPFAGAEIQFSRGDSEGVAARYSPSPTLDDEGLVTVDSIDAATWTVFITDPSRRFGGLMESELVLVAGDDRRIDFALETVSGAIEIVGEDGASLVGRTVHLSSRKDGTHHQWSTWFEIESNVLELTLPVGRHTLMLQRLDRRWGSSVAFDWTASGPSVERIELLEEP